MPDFVQVRGLFVHHHLLIGNEGVHLIDSGFLGGVGATEQVLKSLGLGFRDIKSILLTHGHLDHTFNVARLQELSGCKVYAPLLDQAHIEGRHSCLGWSKVCGALEWLGRTALRYRIPKIDHWFQAGDTLDLWGGLEVISLPGHTVGHCGFLQRERGLLFAGDLFCNQLGGPKPPPRIFNDDHPAALVSLQAASELPLKGVRLNHGRKETSEETLADLRGLVELGSG